MPSEPAPAILLVDDHAPNALAVGAVLEPLGCRIVTASSGAEALERLKDEDFALILMDVHMPVLDGYETVALIRERERWRDIPVVFITAVFDQPEHVHRGYALGAADFIAKPFDAVVLRGKVRALIQMYMRGERAERERRREIERMKDLFLGTLGHDLRGPLNTVLMGAQLIAHQAEARGEPAAPARRIEKAAKRMQRMIDDVLDLTRIQFTGRMTVAPQNTNLAAICRAVIDELRGFRPDVPIALTASELEGSWDPDRLSRVVSNLVGNALDYGGGASVGVRVSPAGDDAILEVHNGGAPIAPDQLPLLFEPFHRGETKREGLGLGLYIVREIVRAHGGSVSVTSSEVEGTTFRAVLPRGAARVERPRMG
jgi:signal transduction histidine kinase